MRVYIESTIPSYLVARPARDLRQAARQQATKEWWDLERSSYDLFISQIVLDEVREGEAAMAKLRVDSLKELPLLSISERAVDLAAEFMDAGVLPLFADRDASHIAIATVHKMDILLTWNCRHIANGAIQEKLREVAGESGLKLPTICTPDELLGERYE
jgi:hypothetical protein